MTIFKLKSWLSSGLLVLVSLLPCNLAAHQLPNNLLQTANEQELFKFDVAFDEDNLLLSWQMAPGVGLCKNKITLKNQATLGVAR